MRGIGVPEVNTSLPSLFLLGAMLSILVFFSLCLPRTSKLHRIPDVDGSLVGGFVRERWIDLRYRCLRCWV